MEFELSGYEFGLEPSPPVILVSMFLQTDFDAYPVRRGLTGLDKSAWESEADITIESSRSGKNMFASKAKDNYSFNIPMLESMAGLVIPVSGRLVAINGRSGV